MEVAGLALSAVQTLLAALQRPELTKVRSILEYRSQLDDLQATVQTLESVLRDVAEIKQDLLSNQEKDQINKLKDAVYEADDLFDEFVTLAHQKKLLKADGRFSKRVRNFLSLSNNPLSLAYRMSSGVSKIKKKLDAIAYNKQFKHDPQPIKDRRPDTCSYVNEVEIIGREDDLENIIGMLLHPTTDNQRDDVSFLCVVGIGGLGKTALAQLVFNDPRVTRTFSWTNWTCVADQDQKLLNEKEVLCKILDDRHVSTMEQVQSQLLEKLENKRYLLVLDDVWTEDRNQWRNLVKYLMEGQEGMRSWIVVTTRSLTTATIVDGEVYELQGLSKEDSWSLFEQTAFTSGQSSNPPNELVEIGRKIVDGCVGVPLAIRVAGSLLYGQDRSKWQSVQEIGLANIRESENSILPILKLSFHHLESPVQSCFAYCAMFPKDFEMHKEELKSLWMAQGYVVPLDKGQSIEDACEEYVSILVKRCFFQNIEKGKYGEIRSFKIHDLMHDIAVDVAGEEILYATKTVTENLNKRVRHLSVANMGDHGNFSVLRKTQIRSHLQISYHIVADTQFIVKALVTNCKWLRALYLRGLDIESLPNCIGRLLHLRYLDLSYNENLQVLPKSFSKLCNMQTLNLSNCQSLELLPKDLSRLVNLRLLDVSDSEFTYMPTGMGKLTNLHWLSDFMVGGGGSSSKWKQLFDSLEDLKALNKLKGSLHIRIKWPKKDGSNVKGDDDRREGLYMRNKEHLNELNFHFSHEEGDDGGKDEELSLMEDLQPHSNLNTLRVYDYKGVKMPGWLTLLPNIVTLQLSGCTELEYLPCLGSLCHLQIIILDELKNLEYIRIDDPSCGNCSTTMPMCGLGSCDKEHSFFPSLKEVWLRDLAKLKGWRRGVVGQVEDNNYSTGNKLQSQQLLPCFSQLQALTIYKCPELTCLPSCPRVEKLWLREFNKGLQITDKNRDEVASASSSSSSSTSTLQIVWVDNMAWLNSVPLELFLSVINLQIYGNEEEGDDLPKWIKYLPALQTLYIGNRRGLKTIPKGAFGRWDVLGDGQKAFGENAKRIHLEKTGLLFTTSPTLISGIRIACLVKHYIHFMLANKPHRPIPNPLPCSDNCGVSINWHLFTDFNKGWSARVTIFNWEETIFADWFVAAEMKNAAAGFQKAYSFNGTVMGDDNTTIFMQGIEGLNYLMGETNGTKKSDPRVPGKQQSVLSFTKGPTPGIRVAERDGFPTKFYFNGEECSLPSIIPINIGYRKGPLTVIPVLIAILVHFLIQ